MLTSAIGQEYNATYWFNKGINFYNNGFYDLAERFFNKSVEINPQLAEGWYNKGNALRQLGKDSEARAAYTKAKELRYNISTQMISSKLKNNTLDDNKVGEGKENDQHPDSEMQTAPLSESCPACNGYPDKCLGFVYGNKPEEAQMCYGNEVECLDQAISQDPNNSEYWYHKGNALHMMNRYDDAIKALDKATDLDPQLQYAWNEKGVVFEQQGNFNDAIRCYNKAIEIDPGWSVPRDNLARVSGRS